jgi:hypothetical protein
LLPARLDKRVFVDRQGGIVLGSTLQPGEERELSEVQQGVFAAASIRLARDQEIVTRTFPPHTQRLTVDGVTGWLYSIVDEYGQPYTLFAYHDGSLYQVKVVFPEVEGRYNPHHGHLYSDGRICFGPAGGLDSLEHVYAKSVVWATGFTAFRHLGTFPL